MSSELTSTFEQFAVEGGFVVLDVRHRQKEIDPSKNPHDMFGVRFILSTRDDCLRFGSMVREKYKIVEGRYRDYISNPWPDGYQSIHIDLIFQDEPIEIQIRTREMDNFSKELILKKGDHYWQRIGRGNN